MLPRTYRSVPAFAAAFALVAAAGSAAHAEIITFTASLSGPAEAPPNDSPGVGVTQVDVDTTANTFRIQVTFSGLLAPVTAAHIHGPTMVPGAGTAGVMTQLPSFVDFPHGVTEGDYDRTFDMTLASTWSAAFITNNGGTPAGAAAAFLSSLQAGTAYLNIHSSMFPGGEIRGFLIPAPTSAAAILLTGGLLATRRRRTA